MDDDELAMSISMFKIVQVLETCGLKVTKRTNIHSKVFMEDEEDASHEQSLGDDIKTLRYSFDVTFADDSSIPEFSFGTLPYIPLGKRITC